MKFEPSLHKLSNGLTVILDPMDTESTKVIVAFATGSRDEKPNEYGITHFCEHMLCSGTKRFKNNNEINDYIDDHSGTWNACTSYDNLQLYGRIYSDKADILLDVFGDLLENSSFDESTIEKERTVILDELRRKQDNKSEKIREFVNNHVFGGKYSIYRTLGTEENIKFFTRKQLRMFLWRRLSSKNCVICVSGKIGDKDALLKKIENRYSFLKQLDVTQNKENIPYTPCGAHYSVKGDKNTRLSIVFPELWNYSKENVFQRMCAHRFEYWIKYNLYKLLRQEKGLVYGLDSVLYGPNEQPLNAFCTTATPEKLVEVITLMAKKINRLYNIEHITADFLNRYKNRSKLGDADFLESNDKRASRLVYRYLDFGILYDYDSIIRMADSMTVEDVIRNSRGYFGGPVSIITNGADYSADLMKVWQENIGNLVEPKTLIMSKDDKCR